jgi:type IV pilus assembly protein PilO
VSQTGLSAGLEFELFQPQPEQPSEFYAQLPINIKVNGTYHQLGEFVSGLAQLPRIVTTHNIVIEQGESGRLGMTAIARTYRAIEESQ